MKWKLVPIEPTREMLQLHGCNLDGLDDDTARSEWAALLAAAPQPTAQDAAEYLLTKTWEENPPSAKWVHDELQVEIPTLTMNCESWPEPIVAVGEPRVVLSSNWPKLADAQNVPGAQFLTMPGGLEWESDESARIAKAAMDGRAHLRQILATAEADLNEIRGQYDELVDLLDTVGVLQLQDDWAREV